MMLTPRTIRKLVRRARAEATAARLVRRDGALAAARAMQVMNFHAKDSQLWRRPIYGAKRELLRVLCDIYGATVTAQTQSRKCWGYADESGNYGGCGGDHCPKCDGSGVLARHTLYLFAFNIFGHVFFWHQPERLVNWEVRIRDRIEGTLAGESGDVVPPTLLEAETHYATIKRYLAEQGVRLPAERTIGLWDAIMADWTKIRLRTRAWATQRLQRGEA